MLVRSRFQIGAAIQIGEAMQEALGTPHGIGQLAALLTNSFLGLTILPTEGCNFRCSYCYEDHKTARMSRETVSALKAFLKNRLPTLNRLKISWFGGEPLLAKDVILEIGGFVRREIANRDDISFFSSATTNGYLLTVSALRELYDAGVTHYQVSLDGPPDVHNQSRLRADGAGTFDRIWANLVGIRSTDLPVDVMLRIHLDRVSRCMMEPLFEKLRKELLDDQRFSVFFRVISKLGGPKDDKLDVIAADNEPAEARKLETALGTGRFKSRNDFSVCYAAHANQFVIRSNGDLAKCTVALYDERNRVGALRPDGTLDIIQSRLRPWLRGIGSANPGELSCPWRGLPRPEVDLDEDGDGCASGATEGLMPTVGAC